jgi:hypothetical protein
MTECLYLKDAYCFQHDALISGVAPELHSFDG